MFVDVAMLSGLGGVSLPPPPSGTTPAPAVGAQIDWSGTASTAPQQPAQQQQQQQQTQQQQKSALDELDILGQSLLQHNLGSERTKQPRYGTFKSYSGGSISLTVKKVIYRIRCNKHPCPNKRPSPYFLIMPVFKSSFYHVLLLRYWNVQF